MPLKLYNTLSKQVETFAPGRPDRVTFYSCGPTVYDDAHIGNFRSFLAADVLRRWVESPLCEVSDGKGGVSQGPRRVVHVMNITDVGHMTDDAEGGEQGEDRMAVAGRRLLEAKKQGKVGADVDPADPYQIARYFENRFREDARKLGLKVAIEAEKDPTLMPRATQSIAGMQAMILRLIAGGHAYVTGRPGGRVVYFRVQSFPNYGRLSGNTLDKLREGAGGRISGENQATKEHPADFLLWKEDPSHIMKWESPWGAGYPGWHIECSVMSASRLLAEDGIPLAPEALSKLLLPDGAPIIDLHSGGEDNIFPHHECEIAQSCAAFNAEPDRGSYARMWFHPRFLLVEGDKMSKSKGNFFTARDLFEGRNPSGQHYEPAAVRLELIKTHYRSNANFTEQGLRDSQRMVERWRKARYEVARRSFGWTSTEPRMHEDLVQAGFGGFMNDDVNIAGAIAWINNDVEGFLRRPYDSSKVPAWNDIETEQHLKNAGAHSRLGTPFDMFYFTGPVLGVLELERPIATTSDIGLFAPGVTPDPAVIAKLEERRAARAAKDFKRSDAIRDEIAAMGYAIKDAAGGKVEVTRK